MHWIRQYAFARLLRVLLLLLLCPGPCRGGTDVLREVFLHPPDEAKPRGYWVWAHGNFDYSAIRRELTEFKAKGLGGVDIFDLGVQDRKDVIPSGPGFLSPEQLDGIAFALEEAKRLRLRMGLIVSSSWNAGGSWTPPELAMMNLVAWSETNTGPGRLELMLPMPALPTSFRKPYGSFPLEVPRDDDGRPLYHREVAVLAYPLAADGRLADPGQVVMLGDRLDGSGKLSWEIPAGRWVVMRAVLANFGQRLWLPSDGSQGLTMDHFSRAATRHHFRTVIDRLEGRVGPLRQTALERLYLASYEANSEVTWTPGFADEFKRLNGYRIEPFLPALFGVMVVDRETTERFRYDYRKTVSELFVENLYREASGICRAHGVLLCSEAGGPGAPLHDVPTEELKALGAVDVMRGEFWNGKTNQLTPDGFEELQIVKPIASAAHIYGHRIVEMESFTSHINWMEGPQRFKELADRAFCEGMTRVVYHTLAHQPPAAGVPGWTYQAGSHMGPQLTWWAFSEGLHTYLARCSALLQQGEFVADVAFYYGDDVPVFAQPKHVRPGLGYGYDYDDLNTEILLQATVNRQGELVLPSGMHYALLVLPPRERRMNLSVLEKLETLIRQGATVLGDKPERTYGLAHRAQEEPHLRDLADRLWGPGQPVNPRERTYGRGRLVVGRSSRELLAERGAGPDLAVHPASAQPLIDYIHRRSRDADVYFIRSKADRPLTIEAQFRVRDRHPEIWDPATGEQVVPAVYRQRDQGLVLPLHLGPFGSRVAVFAANRRPGPAVVAVRHQGHSVFPGRPQDAPWFQANRLTRESLTWWASSPGDYELTYEDGRSQTVTVRPEALPLDLSRGWEARFPAGWEVPTVVEFESLQSWTDSTEPGLPSFSGTASYRKRWNLPPERLARDPQVLLDLGVVREVARVYLNGSDLGVSGFLPHVLDVTAQIRPGENFLVVEVANTWLNRLIADDARPEDQRRTHTNLLGPVGGQRWRDATPLPSGLLGPVSLRFAGRTHVPRPERSGADPNR